VTQEQEPELVHRFVGFVRRASARIVLSSTWRIHDRLKQKIKQAWRMPSKDGVHVNCRWQTFWLAGLMTDLEATNVLDWEKWGRETADAVCLTRGREIEEWLRENAGSYDAWIAIDDLHLSTVMPQVFQGHHVQTSPSSGMSSEDCKLAEVLIAMQRVSVSK